jgi:hypothetical protein
MLVEQENSSALKVSRDIVAVAHEDLSRLSVGRAGWGCPCKPEMNSGQNVSLHDEIDYVKSFLCLKSDVSGGKSRIASSEVVPHFEVIN